LCDCLYLIIQLVRFLLREVLVHGIVRSDLRHFRSKGMGHSEWGTYSKMFCVYQFFSFLGLKTSHRPVD
jgi:hypothetical protein